MVTANDFIPAPYTKSVEQGVFQWSAPSNIALVKYWGKKGKQIPSNPSISFTLNDAHTDMHLAWEPKSTSGIELEFQFEGQVNEAFGNKIVKFLESILLLLRNSGFLGAKKGKGGGYFLKDLPEKDSKRLIKMIFSYASEMEPWHYSLCTGGRDGLVGNGLANHLSKGGGAPLHLGGFQQVAAGFVDRDGPRLAWTPSV